MPQNILLHILVNNYYNNYLRTLHSRNHIQCLLLYSRGEGVLLVNQHKTTHMIQHNVQYKTHTRPQHQMQV